MPLYLSFSKLYELFNILLEKKNYGLNLSVLLLLSTTNEKSFLHSMYSWACPCVTQRLPSLELELLVTSAPSLQNVQLTWLTELPLWPLTNQVILVILTLSEWQEGNALRNCQCLKFLLWPSQSWHCTPALLSYPQGHFPWDQSVKHLHGDGTLEGGAEKALKNYVLQVSKEHILRI